MNCRTLYRPVGWKELELIRDSGWKAFPPRLGWQPVFYPVLNQIYAEQMTSWFAGFLAPGGKYARCFEEVLFAVYDRSENSQNVRPFQDAFATQTV